ncbi:MAG: hypothetical protein ACOZQL_16890, partial [Myxococcota bacterium]
GGTTGGGTTGGGTTGGGTTGGGTTGGGTTGTVGTGTGANGGVALGGTTGAGTTGGTTGGGTTGAGTTGAGVGGRGAAGNPGNALVAVGGPTAEREKALASSMLDKWRYFLAEQMKIEQDIDWVAGFLASRELRDCRCIPRPIPGDIVRRLENKDRVTQLESEDDRNTRCEICLLDAFPRWKVRAQKQCALALELTEFELGVLQRSDDGNGLPPRCLDAAREKQAGRTGTVVLQGGAVKPKTGTGAYIITKAPDAAAAPGSDFLKPADYAPIPSREEGRVYVRVFTSAACVAEVLPGPVVARTGDLLPVPPSASEITVRGPCGGFAELYFGKEEKPRVAESFARNQPLRLQFRTP